MHLKSLVLKGFKSFADRSALALEPGITAIVGPNGSGKSNISDAVLWVLGERSAKQLRGQAMEDVIFAGSSARKPVGIAEVDLVLDNSDGTLPIDYAEVAITRRMYRSGESEYLINGAIARRMDVLDILHDSGLGTGTHSIISQGSLDSILQSRPEDRRALIEEAAGVLKHKQRKAKSERKLEQMEGHVARARDVVAEVQRQLGPLERKAKRARAYQGLAAELAELNLRLAVDDVRALQRAHEAASSAERDLEAELERQRAIIAQAEARVEELQEKTRLESVGAGELARRHRNAAAAVDHIDSAMLVMRERRRSAQVRVAELERTLAENAAKRASAEEALAQMEAQLVEMRGQRVRADELVERLGAAAAELAERRQQLEGQATALGRESRDVEGKLDAARRRQAATQESLSNGLAHIKLIEGHGKELSLQLERAQADAQAHADAAASAAACLSELEAKEAAARAHVSEALQARDAARAAADAARDHERSLASEAMALEEVERTSAAAQSSALAWLLEHGADNQVDVAPLAHAISAPREWESLVERLLGFDVAALVVEDAPCAQAVAALVEQAGEGGEVVLVMREDARAGSAAKAAAGQGVGASASQAAAAEAPLASAAPSDARAFGTMLIDALAYPPEMAGIAHALLGDVVVCESREQAFAGHASDVRGLRFATPDGCIVWPSGKVAVGAAVASSEEGVLARVRRLESLRGQQEAAVRVLERSVAEAQEAEEAMRAAQSSSLALSQELAQQRGVASAARAEADRAHEKLVAVRRELEDVNRQREEAEGIIAEARPSVEELARRTTELAAALDDTKERLAAAQDAVAPLREEAQRVADELAEARLSAAKLAEREAYTVRVRDARAGEMAQLDAGSASARETLAGKSCSVQRIGPLLAVFEELAASAHRWTRSLEEQATLAQDSSAGLHAAVNDARVQARGAHDAFDGINERLAAARVEKGRLEVQVEGAVNVIVRDCKMPLESALALPPLDDRGAVEGTAFKLRRRIANMGTINPDAADEYEALKVRHDYLAAQLADLDGARRTLAKINRVIDARMKDDFVRTYEAVDKNFQEIFGVLFPGGTAHLSLVDPDDVENTGVEVSAQPCGKRIAKMMLMSGGEKSLTALALLFAVYRIRTTPFYILDEVEAALDDTNLRRLASYVDSLRDKTQLIMITHQRRTMEMADVLFGVSMQADGVTKVVSQKLDKALKYAE